MTTSYVHAVASLDGYIADENDEVGPLHDWYFEGDHPLVDDDHAEVHGAPFRVSARSAAYVREMWARQSVLIIRRRLFDLTDGWHGHPPASDHVIVVSHRPKPEGGVPRPRSASSHQWSPPSRSPTISPGMATSVCRRATSAGRR
jgi:hypothetical protein